jgi:hypothetical protein
LSKPSPFEARKSAHLRVTATGKEVILRCEPSAASLEGWAENMRRSNSW